jgi:hypothetical protein
VVGNRWSVADHFFLSYTLHPRCMTNCTLKGISKNSVRLSLSKPLYWSSCYVNRLRQAQSDSTTRVFRDSLNNIISFTAINFSLNGARAASKIRSLRRYQCNFLCVIAPLAYRQAGLLDLFFEFYQERNIKKPFSAICHAPCARYLLVVSG